IFLAVQILFNHSFRSYKPKYLLLKKKLEEEFPSLLNINGEGTQEVTGFFEVMIAGKLVHSKKAGHGFMDFSDKYLHIVAEIKAALGK
uniref:Selenoprotein W n=1 Tax=Vombatus ursinus TaxID=29139 RepID=A0A4X2LXQ8_VOMUR